jgi:hypothetical protein
MRQREGRGNDFLGFAGHVSATPNRGGWWHAVGQMEGTGCPNLAFEPVEAAATPAGEEPTYLRPRTAFILANFAADGPTSGAGSGVTGRI